jgi:hypothetical protein
MYTILLEKLKGRDHVRELGADTKVETELN